MFFDERGEPSRVEIARRGGANGEKRRAPPFENQGGVRRTLLVARVLFG